MDFLLKTLSGKQTGPRWIARRAVGLGLFLGLAAAFALYAMTGALAWFALPVIGAVAGWYLTRQRG